MQTNTPHQNFLIDYALLIMVVIIIAFLWGH
jgi:hypothetical protein